MTALLLAAMLAPAPAVVSDDPFRHAARHALAGQYGPLLGWQRRGYQAALAHTPQARTFVLTAYWRGEAGDCGNVDCRGARLHPGVMACNRLPYGTYVFIPSLGRLFIIKDTGSHANDRQSTVRRTGGTWADVFLERRTRDSDGRFDWTPTPGLAVVPQ
jgi:hypothetical protein